MLPQKVEHWSPRPRVGCRAPPKMFRPAPLLGAGRRGYAFGERAGRGDPAYALKAYEPSTLCNSTVATIGVRT